MFEFKEIEVLTDGEIDLLLQEKVPANEEKGYVPSYRFAIALHQQDEKIGEIDIRIGYTEGLYYGGHIGYAIDEAYRGNSYASKACQLVKQVAIAHGMDHLIITCNPNNMASRRTCEKAGLSLINTVDLPSHNDMYLEGERQKCVYHLSLKKD